MAGRRNAGAMVVGSHSNWSPLEACDGEHDVKQGE